VAKSALEIKYLRKTIKAEKQKDIDISLEMSQIAL